MTWDYELALIVPVASRNHNGFLMMLAATIARISGEKPSDEAAMFNSCVMLSESGEEPAEWYVVKIPATATLKDQIGTVVFTAPDYIWWMLQTNTALTLPNGASIPARSVVMTNIKTQVAMAQQLSIDDKIEWLNSQLLAMGQQPVQRILPPEPEL